jgi:hypothetical protein
MPEIDVDRSCGSHGKAASAKWVSSWLPAHRVAGSPQLCESVDVETAFVIECFSMPAPVAVGGAIAAGQACARSGAARTAGSPMLSLISIAHPVASGGGGTRGGAGGRDRRFAAGAGRCAMPARVDSRWIVAWMWMRCLAIIQMGWSRGLEPQPPLRTCCRATRSRRRRCLRWRGLALGAGGKL